jgi:hypothetical protein
MFSFFKKKKDLSDSYHQMHDHFTHPPKDDKKSYLRLINKLNPDVFIQTADVQVYSGISSVAHMAIFGNELTDYKDYESFKFKINFVDKVKICGTYFAIAFACDLNSWSIKEIMGLAEFFAEFNDLPNYFKFDANQFVKLEPSRMKAFLDALKASSVKKIIFPKLESDMRTLQEMLGDRIFQLKQENYLRRMVRWLQI